MAKDLQQRVADLRTAILKMGHDVEARLMTVTKALRTDDVELAKEVRHGDWVIDEQELVIEKKCMHTLALLHPVAGDLRFILAIMRINCDLERIADLAKNVSKRLLDLDKSEIELDLPSSVREMALRAGEMVSGAIRALADEDVKLAARIRKEDDRVDDLQREAFAWAHDQIPADVDSADAAIYILTIARALERIGDLACNIAEDVIFLVEGTVVRHGRG